MQKSLFPLKLLYHDDSEICNFSNLSFSITLFEIFSATQILELIYAIKTEQKILFYSNKREKIYNVINNLLNLIYPLEWTNTLIPLLSLEMIWC